jgi:CheY-like chemotaxis protein
VILLVEDNETDQQLYGHLLWYNGYTVLHAADGETAIEMALENQPDLILLDMVLEGELTGLDVAHRLRAEGLDVPMVALSARKREELGSAVEEAGISAYLEKPVDPFVVVKEVLHRVGGSEPRIRKPDGLEVPQAETDVSEPGGPEVPGADTGVPGSRVT